MIPVIGEAADLLNAGIYAAEGNYVDASLSLAGMVPFAGAAVTGARMVKNTAKAVNKAIKATNTATDAFRMADNIPLSAATPPIASLGKVGDVPTVKVPDAVPAPKAPSVAPTVKAPDAAPAPKAPDAAPPMKSDAPSSPVAKADSDGMTTRPDDTPAVKGKKGEQYVAESTGQTKNSDKIAMNGNQRIPDFYDATDPRAIRIGEAKNVKYQALTEQLSDDIDYVRGLREAGQVDAVLDLYVRQQIDGVSQTVLSGPLKQAIQDGLVRLHEVIPYMP